MDMEKSEVFWPPTEGGEVRAPFKFITTVS